MPPSTEEKIIRAAGGLLWRRCGSEYEISIVHRVRYLDWTLPKGKLKEGESWEDAAVREVREETGVPAEIVGFAGAIAYETSEGPKVVRFWHMVADGEASSEIDKAEVDEVVWLPLAAAARKAQYPVERALLEGTRPPTLVERRPRYRNSLSLERLANTIEIFEPELESTVQEARISNRPTARWDRSARQLLEGAKRALANEDVERGWRCLKAADRFRFYGLDSEGLQNEAKTLLTEASDESKRLTRWRSNAVRDLLADESGKLKKVGTLKSWEVVRARRILDENDDNRYHKLAILKNRFRLLTAIGIAAIAVWVVLFSFVDSTAIPALADTGAGRLQKLLLSLAVLTSALLGALFSGFSSSIATEQGKTRIPDELSTSTITFARLTLAMISAIAVSIFLVSGVLNLPKPSLELLLAIAFASGFSDRFLMRAIESLTKTS